jgi:hypothetical protein
MVLMSANRNCLVNYSLCFIIFVIDMDASVHKICLDISKFATRIMKWREHNLSFIMTRSQMAYVMF